MILVFILFSFFIVGEILQPSGGHVHGKGILIAGMAPDLSYDNTRSERLNFWGNEMKRRGVRGQNCPADFRVLERFDLK